MPTPLETMLRNSYKEYCKSVDDHYANAHTKMMKKAEFRYVTQWLLTGKHPFQRPGFRP